MNRKVIATVAAGLVSLLAAVSGAASAAATPTQVQQYMGGWPRCC